jgi:hypothetical protein
VRLAGLPEAQRHAATPQELAQHRCILHRQNDDSYSTWKLQKAASTKR